MTHPDPETSIERLIKLAGERDLPSPEGMERARQAAHESWNRMLEERAPAARRSRVKTMLGFAIAAGIAALAVFTWTQRAAATSARIRGAHCDAHGRRFVARGPRRNHCARGAADPRRHHTFDE